MVNKMSQNSELDIEEPEGINNRRGRIVARVPKGTFFAKEQTYQPPEISRSKQLLFRILKFTLPFVGIALIYLVINVFLVGGQELWHKKDNQKLKEMRLELKDTENKINYYESINKNGTITEAEYDTYSKEIDYYNGLVEDYNKLSEKVGGTWYILPVPGK
jgi:hypothetical protein